ncbi:MAG: hypothetical protein M3178_09090 [Pseudomonadota bacterium]|nr:hypothetical protein [Pseudomonadota bacterium]
MAGHGAFPAAREKTREFAETPIMPDDQKGFCRGGRSGKKVPQGINAGVVRGKLRTVFGTVPLEHSQKKLLDFFDQNILQLFDVELRPYRSNGFI